MSDHGFLDPFPLWVVFLLIVGMVCVSVELGYRLGVLRQAKEADGDSPVGAIVGATLGLLAFMLAFTFGLAASRFDARRNLVLQESNAIGTAYLRAAMVAEPERTKARDLLRAYLKVRIEAVRTKDLAKGIQTSARIHDELWAVTVAAAEKDRSQISALFVSAVNDVIDLHSNRVQEGVWGRIPSTLWGVLLFIASLSMSAVGFQMGMASPRRSLATIALVLTFPAVILLIADLDRPGEGFLQVDQQAMLELEASITPPAPSP
jgi:hypothetical protein